MKLIIEIRNSKGLIEDPPELHLCPTSVVQNVVESDDPLETYCQWVIHHFGRMMNDYVLDLKKELKEHIRRKRKIIWTFSV
jgi:hypothetical protein